MLTSIDKKGTKNIEVSTFCWEKISISLILAFSANGNQLPFILIYKPKKGDLIEKTLNLFDNVKIIVLT